MHVVIVGCGRVGSTLGRELTAAGHTAAVIDRKPEAFSRLGELFTGQKITGIGFDREVLIEAGIERAGALAAVTNGDNSNILIARVAREEFGKSLELNESLLVFMIRSAPKFMNDLALPLLRPSNGHLSASCDASCQSCQRLNGQTQAPR